MGYAFKEYDLKHVLALFSVLISPLVLTLPRIAEVLVSVQSGSVSARILQYKEAIRLIELHPILGVGPGNISQYYSTFAIHSEFLRIGAESGIVAFLSMISLWMSGVLYSIRNALTSEEKYGLAVGLIGSLSVMMIEGNLAPGLPWAPWVVLSLIFSLHQVE
jgi:O-antigen ligase